MSLSRSSKPALRGNEVPDAAAPIIGWRAWVLVPGGGSRPKISSIGYPCVWPPGEAMRAECGKRSACSPAPGDSCGCGIHALKSVGGVLNDVPKPLFPPLVLGRVALWGRVVVGARGWRGQLAYPVDLIVTERWPWRFRKPDALELTYGVPVTTMRWSDLPIHQTGGAQCQLPSNQVGGSNKGACCAAPFRSAPAGTLTH